MRTLLSWMSFVCIPAGMLLVVAGFPGLGGVLIIGGILGWFLVDPIMLLLDLASPQRGETGGEGSSRGQK
ncbi:MAG: hypothetical protein HYY54_05695 [candidate division NC10 bacterium]|nr:hypothetical protein [candidate division NC10 bacterium]MBI3003098.1 hypothetical protein [candidate division NC10 bacterium]MBI4391866.1 hypothetical protein [candidate division NC10 bacterium]